LANVRRPFTDCAGVAGDRSGRVMACPRGGANDHKCETARPRIWADSAHVYYYLNGIRVNLRGDNIQGADYDSIDNGGMFEEKDEVFNLQ
jgi:hypothetical protein